MINVPYPYYLCSAEQSRYMDEKTISEFGLDGYTLMEIAGTRAADFIESVVDEQSHGLFFCGKGNNAGDALVVARLLSQHDFRITLCFLSGTDSLSPDTEKNLSLLRKLDGDITITGWDDFEADSFDFIVDGMLGTGLDSEVREPYDQAIEWINEQETPVFALDIPTGLHADNGRILGSAVQADYTLSFGALKAGFYLEKGFDTTGKIVLCELSFPNKYKKAAAYLIDRSWVNASTPDKVKATHKYEEGVLYIIAGSEGLTGAAVMAAKSAWATGIGAVVLITPKKMLDVYEKNLVQVIKKSVGAADDSYFKTSHLEEVQSIIHEKPGKVLIGPGLGRTEETVEFVQQLAETCEQDIIFDADALFALSQQEDWEKPENVNWILTPHPGELKTLLDSAMNDGFDRLLQSSKLARDKNITLLSKGLPSMVAAPDGKTYFTSYDTRIFSRAGFGDVLAGKIGGNWLLQKSAELACFHALLDGFEKATSVSANKSKQEMPEPLDII